MKNFMKDKTLWLLILSFVGIGVGYIFSNAYEFNFCGRSLFCIDLMNYGTAAFYATQAIAFVFLVLLFVPQAFNAWKKFAVWFLPLMFIYFALYENKGFFSVPEESVHRFLSVIYLGASLGIIIVSFISERMVRTGRPALHVLWYWFGALLCAVGTFHAFNFLGLPIF